MKYLFMISAVLFNSLASAATLIQKMDCQKSLVSSIDRLYSPKEGYFFCDEPTTECFLAYENGDTYKIEIPKHPTFVMNEIFIEMADKRQNISHHLVTWVEPKSKQSSYVDIFWGENKRGFAKEMLEANKTKFSESKPIKIESKLIDSVLNKRIDTQIEIVFNNLSKKSYPPGWDGKKYTEEAKRRISNCGWHSKYAEIKKLIESI